MCIQVVSPSTNTTGMIATFRDGKKFAENELFKSDSKVLQINLYFDEVEVCNPLGSKRKIHKLGMCILKLANLCVYILFDSTSHYAI